MLLLGSTTWASLHFREPETHCPSPRPYLSLFTFLPSHMEALIESVLIQMVWNWTKIRTYIQNKIQNKKKKKRFRNAGGLIIPKSAGLFLINLDDVLVLHPQLTWTNSRGETCFSNTINTTWIPFLWYSCSILILFYIHFTNYDKPFTGTFPCMCRTLVLPQNTCITFVSIGTFINIYICLFKFIFQGCHVPIHCTRSADKKPLNLRCNNHRAFAKCKNKNHL